MSPRHMTRGDPVVKEISLSADEAAALAKAYRLATDRGGTCKVKFLGVAAVCDRLAGAGLAPFGIAAVLRQRYDAAMAQDTVRRHVRGQCSCTRTP